jgi:hypothetical protein
MGQVAEVGTEAEAEEEEEEEEEEDVEVEVVMRDVGAAAAEGLPIKNLAPTK